MNDQRSPAGLKEGIFFPFLQGDQFGQRRPWPCRRGPPSGWAGRRREALAGFSRPWCLATGLKWPPALMKSGPGSRPFHGYGRRAPRAADFRSQDDLHPLGSFGQRGFSDLLPLGVHQSRFGRSDRALAAAENQRQHQPQSQSKGFLEHHVTPFIDGFMVPPQGRRLSWELS